MALPDGDSPSNDDRAYQRQQILFHHLLLRTLRRKPRLIPLLVAGLIAAQFLLPSLGRDGSEHAALRVIVAFGHLDEAIRAGQWWRLCSSWIVHQGGFHLIGNVLFMLVLGRPVEAVWGPGRTWLICLAAGLTGSLLALHAHTPIMVGASGVVMGLCGATIALGIRLWSRLTGPLRTALVFVPGVFLIMRLTFDGLSGDVEHLNPYAHQGGALAGFVLGLWLQPDLPGIEGERLPRRWTRLAVALTSFFFAVAIGQALGHLRHPVRLPSVLTQEVTVSGQNLVLPAQLRRGLLSRGQCVGEHTSIEWALETGRTVCFPLEPFGLLLLDRRDHLLTVDTNDLAAMRAADQTGRFVQSEPGIMLYPLGERLLWVLQAPDGALRWHASALLPLLPPPGSAIVRAPPLSGHWLLPWSIALALVVEQPLPHALDLGDGVQLLIGDTQALQDPTGRDAIPLSVAGRSRHFARIQSGVMVYPLPAGRVAVLLGPDSRLDDFAIRLESVLPPTLVLLPPPFSAWVNWLGVPFGLPRLATQDVQ